MKFKHLCSAAAAVVFLFGTTVSVKADGYWQEGYWDDASQTWIEGRWIETGSSGSQGWSAGPYQVYANGATINYDAYGNWTSTVVGNVPVYSQYAYSGTTIGEGGNFGATGCVPTAVAVIMNHFGFGGSPLDWGYMLNANGNYNSWMGHGADSGALIAAGAAYGIGVYAFSDYDSMYAALQSGKLVAACIGGNAAYTHCVVLYGLDAWGNTTVSDPKGSCYRTNIANIVNNMSYNPIDWTAGGPFVAFGW
ncbi:MAG: C39 family peptidase [Solobacterium sp.]|nr:C39 family peptidase [Solobacterium sp.]